MESDFTERWLQLCEQALNENSPSKRINLLEQMERVLAEKEREVDFALSKKKAA